MKIKWLGHSSFLITSDKGTKILTDPYTPGEFGVNYGPIKESADIVTMSHGHADHNNLAAVKGNPKVVKGDETVKGIKITGVAAFHDDSGGGQRGPITMFCYEIDGIRVCHLGDLGHMLSDKQVAALGKIDILMIPVGGNFTMDGKMATRVYEKLAPRIVIPMHYKTARCPSFPVAGVDDFIKGKSNVTNLEVSEAEFKAGVLPEIAQIVVMTPAL